MASTSFKDNKNGIPNFEDLPLRKGDPHHSAWGLYGDNDELGTLNRLTDERVVEAARDELKTGTRSVTRTSYHSSRVSCVLAKHARERLETKRLH